MRASSKQARMRRSIRPVARGYGLLPIDRNAGYEPVHGVPIDVVRIAPSPARSEEPGPIGRSLRRSRACWL